MCRVQGTIHAGVCGFVTHVTARSEDQQHVAFEVNSTCETITALAATLPTVDAYAELGAGFDGELWSAIRSHLKGCCSGCVVPAGLFKTMQVAAGVALPQTASVEVKKAAD